MSIYKRIQFRTPSEDMCDKNCNVLSLGEAVRRWRQDGQFMMTEVNGSQAYEKTDSMIPESESTRMHLPKLEAALAGIQVANEVAEPSKPAEPPVTE